MDVSSFLSAPVLGIAVLTLLAANLIAYFMNTARNKRIRKKIELLAGSPIEQVPSELAAPSKVIDVPVTLITGFLGSGKTSLLNHILANPKGRRICIIENEVGAISIDHSLLATTQTDGSNTVMVLKNGCMCCVANTTGNELESTLDRLISLVTPGEVAEMTDPPFTHLVIETSGIADPAPIIETFLMLSDSQSVRGVHFRLDNVVCVLDSKHAVVHLQDSRWLASKTKEIGQQIAYADTILLNKADLSSEEEKNICRRSLQKINPVAKIIPCVRGVVDVEKLMDVQCFDLERAAELLASQLLMDSDDAKKNNEVDAEHVARRKRKHEESVKAFTLQPGPVVFDRQKFQSWIREVTIKNWENLYRTKALVFVRNDDQQGSDQASKTQPFEITLRTGTYVYPSASLFSVQGVHADVQGAIIETGGVLERLESQYLQKKSQARSSDEHLSNSCNEGKCNGSETSDDQQNIKDLFQTGIVFIGKNLDEDKLRDGFDKLVANPK